MARIAFCWELGYGLGHVARLKPLAEALQANGHAVRFIVREPQAAEQLLDPRRHAWLQAPFQTDKVPDLIRPTRSFAHILHNVGFHDETALRGHARAWRALFDSMAPEVLVFDHSPTALLAARNYPARRIVLGTGFGVPPARRPLPPFPPSVADPDLLKAEDTVLSRVNGVLAALGSASLGRLADLYEADARILFTLAELDHYDREGDVEYWGPAQQEGGSTPSWPEGRRRIFAYLKPFRTLPGLLEGFRQSGHPTLIYMTHVPPELKQQFSGGKISFSEQPLDLNRTLEECDVAVCHAGHGTVSAALLAGKPLLLLPLNVEQHLLAQKVERTGAALNAPALAAEGMRGKLTRLFAEPAFTEQARAFAERCRDKVVQDAPARFVRRVESLLGNREE